MTENKSRVLVIDDERIECLLISKIAEKAGYTAQSARDISTVEQILNLGQSFDYIILDLQLGQSDGLEVLNLLAERQQAAVLILISGFDERIRTASSRLALQLGLNVGGTLRKPVMPNQLLDLLHTAPLVGTHSQPSPKQPITSQDLQAALLAKEITAEFQPKFALTSNRMVGVEVLARWNSEKFGKVSPAEFIPLAENSGQIAKLTELMLDYALDAYQSWQTSDPGCSVAVNISPHQLTDRTLPDQIDAALQARDLPPGCLVLEITESAAFSDMLIATEILTRLRIRGISLSIDDFGTGHASLLSLLNMPFSELKIDQAFVANCHTRSDSKKIVRAAISLARELGLRVVAEGVEVPEMLAVLREANCDQAQGWLLGRPMSALSVAELLATP